MNDEQLSKLLLHCSHYPALYNRISNILFEDFGPIGSVPALLIVWVMTQHAYFYDENELKMYNIHAKEEV